MFGKLLNLATLPLRVAAAPIKATSDLLSSNPANTDGVVKDTTRYILTGKQDSTDNPTDGFCDFDDE